MDSRSVYKDFFSFGVTATLIWHFFWFFLITPDIKIPVKVQRKSNTVFLGSILKESDFFSDAGQIKKKASEALPPKDLSRDIYFTKGPVLMHKPAVFLSRVDVPRQKITAQKQIHEKSESIYFGVSDAAQYLSNIDFSDMRNMFSREDLAAAVEFKILLTKRGAVESIVKYTGSGDPLLDLYIMRKFKMAVFKQPFFHSGWIRLRFKIKE